MTVAVIIPWRAGCPHRERSLTWVLDQHRHSHPDWDIALATAPRSGPWVKADAIANGAAAADADVLVIADADVWCEHLEVAVDAVTTHGWAVPHDLVHRLSPDSTDQVLAGADWPGLPLSADNLRDSRPYRGFAGGGITVVRRDVLDAVPLDSRFVGWGHEDEAWAHALGTLIGPPWRGSADLVHLWHPPQQRATRSIGNQTSRQLLARYRRARSDAAVMRTLVEEGRPCPSPI